MKPRPASNGATTPSRRALCIGINNYPGTDSDLSGCVNDAKDWSAALEARGFDVTTILDRSATRKALITEIGGLVRGANRGDSVVVHFSGHGSYVPDLDGDEPDGTDECLCPHDVDRSGPITDDELYELFSARKDGVKVVMISDSCHSGSVSKYMRVQTPAASKARALARPRSRFLPPAAFLSKRQLAGIGVRRAARASSPPGRHASLLLSGCQDVELSWDAVFDDRPNGAFTFIALRALAKLPKSATYRAWHRAIRKLLPSQQYPQTPNLYGSRSMKDWKVLG